MTTEIIFIAAAGLVSMVCYFAGYVHGQRDLRKGWNRRHSNVYDFCSKKRVKR